MATKTCLWCNRPFEIARKRVALCPGCRAVRHRQEARDAQRRRSDDRTILLNNVLPTLPVELHQTARRLADDCLRRSDLLGMAAGHDRQAPGTKTPAGPDEGTTSEFADLRGELATMAAAAAADPWWQANPPEDVFFCLGEPDRGAILAAA